MIEETTSSTDPNRGGCVVSLALILLPGIATSVWRGSMPGEEWLTALFHGLLLAIPFGFLALDGTRHWLPWFVAIVLTLLFWGALIASIIVSAHNHSGADIGMALVMLASPFVTTLAAWLANRMR
jgi:hypothetical protein